MGKVGKISSILKNYRNNGTLESSLSSKGFSRFPGTKVLIVPCKEKNQIDFRTGLNVESPDMVKLKELDPETYEIEFERITKLRAKLEAELGVDLGPRSPYYKDMYNEKMPIRASFVHLKDGDNIFNLDDAQQEATYEWLKVHTLVAKSYEAYQRGEYSPTVQFYVNDSNIEEELLYKKKTLINKAVLALDTMTIEKRKKVARLLGLPVTENSKEIFVYNLLDSFIKQSEIKNGTFKGSDPIKLFNKISNMDERLLNTKDTVEQAIKYSIYRVSQGGRVKEGLVEIAKSKEDLIDFLMDEKNQEDMIALRDKLSNKKILSI